jgi:hypothetical protein
MKRRAFLGACAGAGLAGDLRAKDATPVVLTEDGGWCWFEDERAIVVDDQVIFGTVATGYRNPKQAGEIRVTQYNMRTGNSLIFTLHSPAKDENPKQWVDDHNSPALLLRPDGKLLAMYARHGTRNEIHYRISSRKRNAAFWGDEKMFVPSEKSRVTYSNLFHLRKEKKTYNFFRGYDNSFKPSYMTSEDEGDTWKAGGVFINVPSQFRHRPYVKYCSNNVDTVHVAYTEGHPRDFDNSVYHVFYREGHLHRSDGTRIARLEEGLRSPDEGTRIFQGGPDAVAWTTDFHVLNNGQLVLVYTVQKDGAGKKSREGGEDHRFRLAHWDGRAWRDGEIAYAGSRLYAGEDDYTGLAAIDPNEAGTVFISTNAHPVTGERMKHREIFRGVSRDMRKFEWTAVTENSTADNVRPIVPLGRGGRRALLWLRGEMRTYTDYSFDVVGLFEQR